MTFSTALSDFCERRGFYWLFSIFLFPSLLRRLSSLPFCKLIESIERKLVGLGRALVKQEKNNHRKKEQSAC